MIPQKDLERQQVIFMEPIILSEFVRNTIIPFIDKIALDLDQMIVSAGEVGHSIIVSPQDLASFVKADFADILEDSK